MNSPVANQPVVRRVVVGPRATAKARVLMVLAAALAVGVAAGILVFHTGGTGGGKARSPGTLVPTAADPTKRGEPVRTKPVVAPMTPGDYPQPSRHVELTVQPAKASLAVDNHLPGKQATPRSRAPLKKAAGSARERYDDGLSDDYLDSKLKKADVPTAQVGSQSGDTKVAPAPSTVEEFGMSLQRPITRHPLKRIDETDPYVP